MESRIGVAINEEEETMSHAWRTAILTFWGVIGIGALNAAIAQEYPNKPVRWVVSNSPGALADTVSRLVAPEMSKFLGQPIVVENRTGGGNLIGYEHVARQAAPDGYTVVAAVASELATYPVTVKDLRFDPVKDLPVLVGIVESRLVMGSAASDPWKSFNEFVAHARANPGKLNYGTSAALTRLLSGAVIQKLDLNMVDIPYTGGGPMFQAALAGQVQMVFVGESTALGNPEKFRVLAVTGDKRRPPFMDIPTFAELGHPQIPGLYVSLNTAAGLPRQALDRLYDAASKALQNQDIRARFAKISLQVVDEPRENVGKRVPEEARLFAEIAKRAGMQPQ